MTLNELRDEAFAYAEKQGFHEAPFNFGESLMLIVSELSEALEAERNGREVDWIDGKNPEDIFDPEKLMPELYVKIVKGTVEEEIADAVIRICHLAGSKRMNLDWHVRAKMAYNKTRPYKHGKKY